MPTLAQHQGLTPSDWVVQCVQQWLEDQPHGPAKARVLDLACGAGRHAVWLAQLGFAVHAVDRQQPEQDLQALGVDFELMDLEQESWPLLGQQYDVIVVTNYLYRPHLPNLLDNLKSQGGLLVYETFMAGNAEFGSPRNPDFLLRPNELLQAFQGLNAMRFEQGLRLRPNPAMIQRGMFISGAWSEIQSGTKTLFVEGMK
ncbi:MAG TPA: methyltransferase domain-containing protein [Limnobacter sp.]|nr:methyltransferase domain-containing protein [Limnobacter sp.]